MLVDLTKKPYELNKEQIDFVEDVLRGLTVKEKIQQLFIALLPTRDASILKTLVEEEKFGGIRYNPGSKEDIYLQNKLVQETTSIPVFVAANTESGGNGACKEGTEIGCETKIGATDEAQYAYKLGKVCAKEAKAIGVNVLFSPIVDIHSNFHNPVISNRTFSSNPQKVKRMSLEYLKACQEEGVLACAKHFPGDGFDERDQHLSLSSNPLSVSKWDKSFGKVYSALIDKGLPMVMVGHISLESYQRKYNPSLKQEDVLPATLSKEIVTDLLKGQLGFNGLVVTDATHMVGLTSAMSRRELLPNIIKAGCDMILFYNDYDEDISYMLEGYSKGIFDEQRLDDAVRRILGLKVKLGYSSSRKHLVDEPHYEVIGAKEHKLISDEVCKKSITLVKNRENIIPLNPIKHKRVLLVVQEDENPFSAIMKKPKETIYDYFSKLLENEGFVVTRFVSLMDKVKNMPPYEAIKAVMNVYGAKTPVSNLVDNYDLIIQMAHFDSHNTVERISWKMSKGTADIPWYVHEVPTIFISLKSPFHLFDVPQVKTYINCYDKNRNTIEALVRKLVGKEEFEGVSPVDAFCDTKNTRY